MDELFRKVSDNSDRFPIFLKPFDDELFSSWVVRLAHAHYMKAHTFANVYFPNDQFWNRDIDRSVTYSLIENIAYKAYTKPERIFKSTLKDYEIKLNLVCTPNTIAKWLLPLRIYHRTWKNYGLTYCPICLLNDGKEPYFRLKWRLALSVICDNCGVYLNDRCPKCAKPVMFFRSDLGKKSEIIGDTINKCFNCNFNLAEGRTNLASSLLCQMQKELYRVLNEGLNNEVFYPHSYFQVLHHLIMILAGRSQKSIEIRNRLYLLLKLNGGNYPGGFIGRFEILPLENKINLLYSATWLLEEWPFRYMDFFKGQKVFASTLINPDYEFPFWYWKVVYENFYNSNVNRRFW